MRREQTDSLAAASVWAVSYARSGDTSNETHPSTPFDRSWIGRKRSAARVRSCRARSKKSASPALPFAELFTNGGVVGSAAFDRVIEDRRIRRKTGHREFVYVALERAVVQQIARDVVEPDALTLIVEQLCRFQRVTSTRDLNRLFACQQRGQVIIKQAADALYRHVRGRTCGDNFFVVGSTDLDAGTRSSRGRPRFFSPPPGCAACHRPGRSGQPGNGVPRHPMTALYECRSARGRLPLRRCPERSTLRG